MPTFLFWNIHNNANIGAAVVDLALRYNVDVVMLAEAPANLRPAGLLTRLNASDPTRFSHLSSGKCLKIEGYVSHRYAAKHVVSTTDYVLFTLESGRDRLLAAGVHFPSKMYEDDYEQRRNAENLAQAIQAAEDSKEIQHQNTLLIGDFNMNPFERGMVAANGLHAVMTRKIAEGKRDTPGARVVAGQEYRLFYNPMWAQMGERNGVSTGLHYGTYYYDKGSVITYFWNWFDQALLRPALLSRFKDENLRVLTSLPDTYTGQANKHELLTNAGLPNTKDFSDHLPILILLDEMPEETL